MTRRTILECGHPASRYESSAGGPVCVLCVGTTPKARLVRRIESQYAEWLGYDVKHRAVEADGSGRVDLASRRTGEEFGLVEDSVCGWMWLHNRDAAPQPVQRLARDLVNELRREARR